MRLLNLPVTVQRKVAAGIISAGHARALLSIDDPLDIEKLANRIVAEGLSVRAVEEIVSMSTGKKRESKVSGIKSTSPILQEIGDVLGNKLDTRVSVELGQRKGKITIEFANLEDLERISKLL